MTQENMVGQKVTFRISGITYKGVVSEDKGKDIVVEACSCDSARSTCSMLISRQLARDGIEATFGPSPLVGHRPSRDIKKRELPYFVR